MAAHARLGFNVVADLGIHEGYSRPVGIWQVCADRLEGINVMIVGVRCSVEDIMRRREASGGDFVGLRPDGAVPDIVHEWEGAVHDRKTYDLEVDAGIFSPQHCAKQILSAARMSNRTALQLMQTGEK
jgi:chloramphenicol 3-O phosphotransferase